MKTLICLGDSLTAGADLENGHPWPSRTAEALGLQVINCGISGDTTQGMLSRFYPEVVTRKPDYVFIMGGTNDLWWDWEVRTILGNIFSMVCQAQHHEISPVIGLPPPLHLPAAQMQDFFQPLQGYDRLAAKLTELIEKLESAAAMNEVPAVDFYRTFLQENGQTKKALFLDDGLHPNQRGHDTMASKVAALFRNRFQFS